MCDNGASVVILSVTLFFTSHEHGRAHDVCFFLSFLRGKRAMCFFYTCAAYECENNSRRATSTRLNDRKWVFEYYFLFQDLNQSNGPIQLNICICYYLLLLLLPPLLPMLFKTVCLCFTRAVFLLATGCFSVYSGTFIVFQGIKQYPGAEYTPNNANRFTVKPSSLMEFQLGLFWFNILRLTLFCLR